MKQSKQVPTTKFVEEESKKEQVKQFYRNCSQDFEFFSKHSLKIRNKAGETVPLVVNRAQTKIHEILQRQLKENGKVRAVIIKGRQQGVSTYVQARFFWKLLHNKGLKAYILTHLSEATQHLFSMAKRFLDYLPVYRPELGKSNYHELVFKGVDCGYKVGTAGSTGVGRGETIQLFHGSEIGYYPNAEEHFSGVLQAVSDQPNTEIIFESTANGTGNLFHRLCMDSAKGESGFELIFIPWTLQEEYATPITGEPLVLADDEHYLIQAHDLSLEQLNWRREKIKQFGDIRRFKQEYPLDLNEAFMADADRAFIQPIELQDALNHDPKTYWDTSAPMIIGIDPARYGQDSTGYAIRAGRQLLECGELPKEDTMALCGRIIQMIRTKNPIKVFIDMGSFGAAIYDRLREQGYREVMGVNFGERPDDPERYANKRAELYDRIKRWLGETPCKIPNDQKLISELSSINFSQNSSGKLLLEKKEDMARRGVKSPNLADAFALTFCENTLTNVKYTQNYINTPKFDISWDPFSI